jgi:hypothetical protein
MSARRLPLPFGATLPHVDEDLLRQLYESANDPGSSPTKEKL